MTDVEVRSYRPDEAYPRSGLFDIAKDREATSESLPQHSGHGSLLLARAKGVGEEVRGRLSGQGFSTVRREERRRMRSEFPRWGNERADEPIPEPHTSQASRPLGDSEAGSGRTPFPRAIIAWSIFLLRPSSRLARTVIDPPLPPAPLTFQPEALYLLATEAIASATGETSSL